MRVELPWPPSKLSRNGSQRDYRGKARAARQYKHDCLLACKADKLKPYEDHHGERIMIRMVFHAPSNARRDLDNLLAMTKQGIDAVAETIGIDDSHFDFTIRKGKVSKPAKVVVRI